jgi:hypothetical protein
LLPRHPHSGEIGSLVSRLDIEDCLSDGVLSPFPGEEYDCPVHAVSIEPSSVKTMATVNVPALQDVCHETPTFKVPTISQLTFDGNEQVLAVSSLTVEEERLLRLLQASSKGMVLAHMDDGAVVCTTDRLDLLHDYVPFTEKDLATLPSLRVADGNRHKPRGKGYVKMPASREGTYVKAFSYYTPAIPVTIVSPTQIAEQHRLSPLILNLSPDTNLYPCIRFSGYKIAPMSPDTKILSLETFWAICST